ncbi:hypothetical protein [Nitratireductor rhodophyticola]|uniref:hypothetical protein n=1 Tax=Nitratireductor rhodophyticola TaxID=2854036 RepID=UPI00300B620C
MLDIILNKYSLYALSLFLYSSSCVWAEDASGLIEKQMDVASRCLEAARMTWTAPLVLPDDGGFTKYGVAVVAGPSLTDAYRPVFVCLVDMKTGVVELSKGLDISPLLPGVRALTGE